MESNADGELMSKEMSSSRLKDAYIFGIAQNLRFARIEERPQASEKTREFDLPEVSFVVNIKYLIRGGAKGIRTACLSLMRSRTLGIFPSSMSNYRTTVRHGRCGGLT